MEIVEITKDTTLDCINILIDGLEQYELWFDNEKYCKEELQWLKGWSERIKENLLELKAIKETNPTEAMRCFHIIEGFMRYYEINDTYKDELTTIKQALIKAQEQDEVLKIIKTKRVIIAWFEDGYLTLNEYNAKCEFGYELTQEEFNLVKRWRKNVGN